MRQTYWFGPEVSGLNLTKSFKIDHYILQSHQHSKPHMYYLQSPSRTKFTIVYLTANPAIRSTIKSKLQGQHTRSS